MNIKIEKQLRTDRVISRDLRLEDSIFKRFGSLAKSRLEFTMTVPDPGQSTKVLFRVVCLEFQSFVRSIDLLFDLSVVGPSSLLLPSRDG